MRMASVTCILIIPCVHVCSVNMHSVYLVWIIFIYFVISLQAKEEGARGEQEIAVKHAKIALYLNIAAIVFWIVIWIIWIAVVAAS